MPFGNVALPLPHQEVKSNSPPLEYMLGGPVAALTDERVMEVMLEAFWDRPVREPGRS